MSRILQQMNSVTMPSTRRAEPVQQIRNYFFLLTTMMKLGLQLIWEKQHGLNYFTGVMDTKEGRAMYDDIVRCVMRPTEETSEHFHPEVIDMIAEKLATPGTRTGEALDYIKTIISHRIDSEDLISDGDTHQPPFGWITPHSDAEDAIEFRDEA